jgi:hypothetical protein
MIALAARLTRSRFDVTMRSRHGQLAWAHAGRLCCRHCKQARHRQPTRLDEWRRFDAGQRERRPRTLSVTEYRLCFKTSPGQIARSSQGVASFAGRLDGAEAWRSSRAMPDRSRPPSDEKVLARGGLIDPLECKPKCVDPRAIFRGRPRAAASRDEYVEVAARHETRARLAGVEHVFTVVSVAKSVNVHKR